MISHVVYCSDIRSTGRARWEGEGKRGRDGAVFTPQFMHNQQANEQLTWLLWCVAKKEKLKILLCVHECVRVCVCMPVFMCVCVQSRKIVCVCVL